VRDGRYGRDVQGSRDGNNDLSHAAQHIKLPLHLKWGERVASTVRNYATLQCVKILK